MIFVLSDIKYSGGIARYKRGVKHEGPTGSSLNIQLFVLKTKRFSVRWTFAASIKYSLVYCVFRRSASKNMILHAEAANEILRFNIYIYFFYYFFFFTGPKVKNNGYFVGIIPVFPLYRITRCVTLKTFVRSGMMRRHKDDDCFKFFINTKKHMARTGLRATGFFCSNRQVMRTAQVRFRANVLTVKFIVKTPPRNENGLCRFRIILYELIRFLD